MTAVSEGGASLEELDDAMPAAGSDAFPEGAFPEAGFPEGAFPEDESSEIAEDEQPVRLRVAPKPSRTLAWRRRRARLLVFGVAALSAASMFLLVAFHVFAAQSAFQLDKLDTQLSKEQRDDGYLRDRVATLSSPQAVASAAEALHMVRSPEVTMLNAPTAAAFGSTVGLPVPPPKPYGSIDSIVTGP